MYPHHFDISDIIRLIDENHDLLRLVWRLSLWGLQGAQKLVAARRDRRAREIPSPDPDGTEPPHPRP